MDAAAWDLTSPGGTKRQALLLVPQNDPAGPKLVQGKETLPNLHRWLLLTPLCHSYGSVWSFMAVCAVCWQNNGGSEMFQAAFDCCPADKIFGFVLNYNRMDICSWSMPVAVGYVKIHQTTAPTALWAFPKH